MSAKGRAASGSRSFFDVPANVPELGLFAGDTVSYDARDGWEPTLVHRPVPIPRAALERALALGQITCAAGALPPASPLERAEAHGSPILTLVR